jgi:hypothetical protein
MRIDGLHWSVWRARGPLWQRQIDANHMGCVCYVEQHLNASTNKDVNYATALVAKLASKKSKDWARDYVALVAKDFDIRDAGIVVGPPRGEYNIKYVHAPAILVEPGFVSNHDFANVVQSGGGVDGLALTLVNSIRRNFPEGGLVALSVGHLYRGTGDQGAPVNDIGDTLDPAFDTEGELNDAIITAAEETLIASYGPDIEERPTDPAPAPEGESA